MLVLITYDVSVLTKAGQRRLRNIAKTCLDYGMRVQNSVFECEVTPDQWVRLKTELTNIYDSDEDSLRFYMLGSKGRQKIEHLGTKVTPDPIRDTIIL
jgi:CRISPR-associated protein Cas2